MPSNDKSTHPCPQCGEIYPPETLVCARCKEPLVAPSGRQRTPAWVIILLLIVIAVLLVYIFQLINTNIIQRNY